MNQMKNELPFERPMIAVANAKLSAIRR